MNISKTSPPNSNRNTNIDKLRGWLIILVIVGHIVLGSVHDNFIRYSIYAFHMPLFIGLSGYLINAEFLKLSPFWSILMRYWWRVVLPFGFAFAFYTGILAFHAFEEGRLSVKLLLSYAHTPYYHLWFIPTLVLWVLAFAAFLKLRLPLMTTLTVFLVLTFIWAGVSKDDLPTLLAPLLSKKVIYFFSFFLFGAWLKTPSSNRIKRMVTSFRVLPIALMLLCAIPYLVNIGTDKSVLKASAWTLLNLSLIVVLVTSAVSAKHGKATFISDIGRLSLPIYLWHMLPLFLLKGFDVHQSHTLIYYALGTASVALIVWLMLRLEGRNTLLDRCLYGSA